MDKELKQEFTRRISSTNRGGMIVVIYDICFAYMEEAIQYHQMDDYPSFKGAVAKADKALGQLRENLNFNYPIAGELYSLYQFAGEQLAKSIYKNKTEGILAAKQVLKNLYAGFVEAAKQDLSEPLMSHAQQVVAGMTYGKGSLNEAIQLSDTSRGFLA